MDLAYSAEAEQFRSKIQAFLKAHLPDDWHGLGSYDETEYTEFVRDWRKALYENSLLAPSWPKEYGGAGLTPIEQVVLLEEFSRAGVPKGSTNDEFSIDMIGNTVLDIGTEEQKAYFLPRILSGEIVWCQGFSEPEAGSDLASLRTRAVLDGDEWVINGQKIWTSDGMYANWIMVLARTDPEARKNHGITFLLAPIEPPAVNIRPIRALTGENYFCETFFTDARIPKENVLGEVNKGWQVAMHLLSHERGQSAVDIPARFKADLERLVALAQERGVADDPLIKQRLARCHATVEIMRGLGLRSVTGWLRGDEAGIEDSIFKVIWSEYHQVETRLAMDILGEEGLITEGRQPPSGYVTDDAGAPNSSASWQGSLLKAMGGTIYAGTSEIQRSIIGERGLGLPREPRPAPAV